MKEIDNNYGYYSKLLNKPFDTLDELKAAEEAHKKAEEEKQAKALAKKQDAVKVEDAFKNLNSAKHEYNAKRAEIVEAYTKAVAEAKKIAKEQLQEVTAKLEEAEKGYSNALSEFNKSHPEGFHITLRDGDSVTTISQSNKLEDYFDFGGFFDSFFKWFK